MLTHSLVGLDQIRDVLLLLPVSDFHDKGDFHHHHPKYCMLMVNHWSQIDGSCSDFDAMCLAIGISSSGTDLVLICSAHASFISATTVSVNGLFSSALKWKVCTIRKEMLNIQMFSSRRNIFLFMFSWDFSP